MLIQKEYTQIYTMYDEYGYIQLLLYNCDCKDALLFSGVNFSYIPFITKIPSDYQVLPYCVNKSNTVYELESIRESSTHFIKFKSGDIFQIYFMPDDNKSYQILSIYQESKHKNIFTPLGLNLYESVLKSYNEAEECEI